MASLQHHAPTTPLRQRMQEDMLMRGFARLLSQDEPLWKQRDENRIGGADISGDIGDELPSRYQPHRSLTTLIVNGLLERRALISASGPNAYVLKIRPPLVLQREHADLLLDSLDDSLGHGD